eukprot:TRINITY_DN527_c0_g1_i1.p1 TRINITY_DN527_c0_g1~~TRINITY_DN527_c0_g1_i1.p1  ORF type:complete len:412 (+),score=59.06 TRINITY_DN527_c0_g1_i1:103-1338(+)
MTPVCATLLVTVLLLCAACTRSQPTLSPEPEVSDLLRRLLWATNAVLERNYDWNDQKDIDALAFKLGNVVIEAWAQRDEVISMRTSEASLLAVDQMFSEGSNDVKKILFDCLQRLKMLVFRAQPCGGSGENAISSLLSNSTSMAVVKVPPEGSLTADGQCGGDYAGIQFRVPCPHAIGGKFTKNSCTGQAWGKYLDDDPGWADGAETESTGDNNNNNNNNKKKKTFSFKGCNPDKCDCSQQASDLFFISLLDERGELITDLGDKKITMTIPLPEGATKNNVKCSFFDKESQCYSQKGCEMKGVTKDGTQVICECNHLTDFNVVFSSTANGNGGTGSSAASSENPYGAIFIASWVLFGVTFLVIVVACIAYHVGRKRTRKNELRRISTSLTRSDTNLPTGELQAVSENHAYV